jgi:hypothetical protein
LKLQLHALNPARESAQPLALLLLHAANHVRRKVCYPRLQLSPAQLLSELSSVLLGLHVMYKHLEPLAKLRVIFVKLLAHLPAFLQLERHSRQRLGLRLHLAIHPTLHNAESVLDACVK